MIWSGLFTTISVERPENLDLGLFTEQTCYILSAEVMVPENARKEVRSKHCRARGKRCAEEARTDAYPYFRHLGSQLCGSGMPFPEKHR